MNRIKCKVVTLFAIILLNIASAWAQDVKTHTVERGETLSSIATKYGVSQEEIIKLNPDAKQFIYVGMELVIPVTPAETAIPQKEANTPAETTKGVQQPHTSSRFQSTPVKENRFFASEKSTTGFEDERESAFYEIGYAASRFDEAKLTGSYGIGGIILPWELAPQFYIGIHFSPINFNFGLVDSDFTSVKIKLGPALGYYFTSKVFVAMPIDILCNVYPEPGDSGNKTAWGMSLAPAVYLGHKHGIFMGPQLEAGFSGGSDVTCGFRVGVFLSI